MAQSRNPNQIVTTERPVEVAARRRRGTKKERILKMYSSGMTNLNELSAVTGAKPSYVASVLQGSGLLKGYFDLYTHTSSPMNVYAKEFKGKLGFKDEAAARRSVDVLSEAFARFGDDRDRAGQHHALVAALTMFDRARWCGKTKEADVFRQWLIKKLFEGQVAQELPI